MPRVNIPVVGPAAKNREKKLSAQVTQNLFPEINPESRAVAALHNTPGLKSFAALEGADRGTHDFNNTLYTVNGTSLYKIDATGIDTNLGTIAGTGRCVFADDGTQLVIATGSTPYIYTVSGGLQEITDPDLVNPNSVAYLNSQFIFDQNNGTFGEFVTSEVTSTFSVNALDFARAEAHPDDIIRVYAFNQLVYFFGSHTVEPWWNSGSGRPPFDRVQGGVRPYGLAGTHAVTNTPDHIYFLGADRIPRRMSGVDAVSIGTPSLGVEWASYSKIDDCIVYHYVQDHQNFIVFTFPTANRTWTYHEPSNSWFRWSYGVNGDRHRASSVIGIYGLNFAADHTNGNIYELDPCTHTDDGEEIQRRRITTPIHGGLYGAPGKRLYYNKVEFVLAYGDCVVRGTGQGPQPATTTLPGVCATTASLAQNNAFVLQPTAMMLVDVLTRAIDYGTSTTDGNEMDDSYAVSCTFGFARENAPAVNEAGIIDIYDVTNSRSCFHARMGTDGFIYVRGRDNSNTQILNCKITNNGASFADSTAHLITFVANMDDETKREVYVDGTDVTDNTSYVTWTTYELGQFQFRYVTSPDDMNYCFGQNRDVPQAYAQDNSSGFTTGVDTIGFICIDNRCTLVGAGVWDQDGLVRDPQGDFSGWFTTQPRMAFSTSLAKQEGQFSEVQYSNTQNYERAYGINLITGARINDTGAGTTEPSEPGTLPPPPSDPNVELGSPHWSNLSNSMTANWVNLNNYTQVSYAAVFGYDIEFANQFENTFTVNKAARVSTTDPDQRLSLVGTTQYINAALVLCSADGRIVDWCSRVGTPEIKGGAITIPADGQDYYIVMTSDTGRATIRMWDASR